MLHSCMFFHSCIPARSHHPGAYAEFAAVKEESLAYMPKDISFEQAAAIPLAGLTAWQVGLRGRSV